MYFTAGWISNRRTQYALTLNGIENISTAFNISKKINGFDLKFNIDTDLLYDNRSQNANISINKVF